MIMLRHTFAALALLALLPGISRAQDTPQPPPNAPTLSLPIDCTIGEDCWVVNYLDMDTTGNIEDLRCGMRSYNGHKGTDIALPDRMSMFSGVDVLAPADGTVIGIRNTEADHDGTRPNLTKARQTGKTCGNGVDIYLGNEWTAKLCHLKQGSVVVKPEDKVKRGQKIAEVGLSGLSEFAHLHIALSYKDTPVDPFTGLPQGADCIPPGKNLPGQSLWAEDSGMAYSPVDLYAAGFSSKLPDYKRLKENTFAPSSLPIESKVMTFWVIGFGLSAGDKMDIVIRDPHDQVFAQHHEVHDRNSAQYMYWIGKKTEKTPLVTGPYTATATLTRQTATGEIIQKQIRETVNIR